MSAASQEPKRSLFLKADFETRLWSTKEGVGETSGQTVGSSVRGINPVTIDPAEERSDLLGVLRSVRTTVRNVTRGLDRGES
jgi:hypothetical protein